MANLETSLPILAHAPGLDPSDPAYAGQAVYTPRFLAHVYDPLVVRYNNRFVWRCPSTTLMRLYQEHIGDTHLDVGPGTAFYLDRCRIPTDDPKITLLDPNPAVLQAASARLARYEPRTHQADLLKPLQLAATYDSIALTHVLHCLPGTIASKAYAFEQLRPLLKPEGVIFGSTVLAAGVRHTKLSRRVMTSLNRKGIFTNENDDREGLEAALVANFADVQLRIKGTVAIFTARRPTS
jgi:SAM-dependent methyltransferase